MSLAERDIIVPPALSRQLAAAIPGATLATIAGAGHGYFWEQADAFTRMCLAFLTRQGG